jgi:spermidine synthase
LNPGRAGFALGLALLSGAAGLGHQLLWVRRMVDVLGANADTFSKVIGVFFLGLAGGAWLAARFPVQRPWRAVALAELSVAVLALGVLCAGGIPWHEADAPGRWLKWLLPIVLIGPPACAMGLVIPWMARALGAERSVRLYAINTLGGVLGILLTLLVGLPALGLAGASLSAIALNVLCGLGALFLTRNETPAVQKIAVLQPAGATVLGVAFGSGFLVLGGEVLLQHQLAQVAINSYLSSGAVLALVLGALALAAALAPWMARLKTRALPLALGLAALECAIEPLLFIVQRGGLHYLPYALAPWPYAWSIIRLGVGGFFGFLLPAGLVFPLLMDPRSAPQPAALGAILAVNGLGGWLGAEFANGWLAPHLGLWSSMSALGAGYGFCALGCVAKRHWLWMAPALGISVFWSSKIDARLPHAALGQGEHLLAVGVGREGVVAAVETTPEDRSILFNNTYTLGGSRAQLRLLRCHRGRPLFAVAHRGRPPFQPGTLRPRASRA